MAYLASNSAPRSEAIRTLDAGFLGLIGRFTAWRSYRSTVKALSALSDAELEDIGVSRCDIRHVATTSAR